MVLSSPMLETMVGVGSRLFEHSLGRELPGGPNLANGRFSSRPARKPSGRKRPDQATSQMADFSEGRLRSGPSQNHPKRSSYEPSAKSAFGLAKAARR
jgi:hypothetical protein